MAAGQATHHTILRWGVSGGAASGFPSTASSSSSRLRPVYKQVHLRVAM